MLFMKMKGCALVLKVIVFAGFVVQCLAMSLSELEDFASFLKKTSQFDETLKKGTDTNEYDEDDAVSDHAWEESGKFEGDLILNERQRRMIVEEIAEGLSRNGLRDSTKRWPDNEVIYFIQREHFSSDQVDAIQNGIDDLAQASCVKFRPYKKGDRDAVVIQGSRRGCFSQVGYQGGFQVLNLSGRHPVGRGCFRHGTVVHELLHTLGFYHMQSSPDRDDYVDIAWENIVQPARHNFRKYNAFSVSDFGVGYDYESVLHYSRRAFSSNGQDTIIPKQGGAEIGQRIGLSDKDTQKLNKMYCDADNNNEGDETGPIKSPNKKKNHKNKPFEGHGIGYDKGKTVVIKLLPSTETYHIINKPHFPMFHHFSKAPQVLSPKEVEGFGTRKEISDDFKHYKFTADANVQDHKKLQDFSGLKTVNINNVGNTYENVHELKDGARKTAQPPLKSDEENVSKSTEADNDELNEAFDRLAKILKTHVYPTHFPDLKPYKINTDYSEFEDPKNIPVKVYDFVLPSSKEQTNIRGSSESDYIKSLYNNGPDTLNNNKQIYEPNKVGKIVYDQNNFKGYNDEESEGHNKFKNIKNQYKDINEIYHPHLQYKSVEELKNPKEMYELVITPYDISKDAEATYRTSYPFKVHQLSSNGSLELKTPEYAQYANLKDKHNYSALYEPNHHADNGTAKSKYTLLGDTVPTYDKWYQKDYLRRNPVDYDRKSFSQHSPHSNIRIYDVSGSAENDSKEISQYTGSLSPKTKEAYTLYGEPVPLTENWYKVNSQKLIEYPRNHYQPKQDYASNEDER